MVSKMIEGRVYINGQWLDGDSHMDVIKPETQDLLGSIVNASQGLVESAVDSAHNAFAAWQATSVDDRCAILGRAADILVQEYGDAGEPTPLKSLISEEMGKRLPEADIEVIESSDMVRYFANHGPAILQRNEISIESELWANKRSYALFEPCGTVAVIKPWNYPLEIPLWSIAAALAAGNTVVFKPSELSTFVGLEIGRVFERAGLPAGVLNIITGGGDVGHLLAQNSKIDMISFTGSRATGIAISRVAAEHLTPVSLELGGNDAAVVLDDADLDLAVNGVLWGAVCNSGQVCVGTKRVFVNEDVADVFEARLLTAAKVLRPRIDYGPLVSRKQLETVERQVSQAVGSGAKVLLGGIRLTESGPLYYPPTILTDVKPEMEVMRAECFGPVIPVMRYGGDDVAVAAQLNDVQYGLGASIWTSDRTRGEKLAARCDVGMVWVNDVNIALAEAPWGGRKGSGSGVELSPWGLRKYSLIKHVNVDTSDDKRRDWWYPYSTPE